MNDEYDGMLIHAFYIIIFASFRTSFSCYLHCFYFICITIDDFGDFLTKSLALVFNSWVAENPLFLFLCFQDFPELQIGHDFNHVSFSWNEEPQRRRRHQGRPLRPKEGPPCGHIPWPRSGTHLVPRGPPRIGLFMDSFVPTENLRHTFSMIYRGGGGGGSLFLLQIGRAHV